jgi:hypothetical protein
MKSIFSSCKRNVGALVKAMLFRKCLCRLLNGELGMRHFSGNA